jgi:hypothetical protein
MRTWIAAALLACLPLPATAVGEMASTLTRTLQGRLFRIALVLLAGWAVAACAENIQAYEGAPLPSDRVATVAGGGLPSLVSVDGKRVGSNAPLGQPQVDLLPGPHRLVIRYQPCSTYNNCGLADVTAEVVLQEGGSYALRQAVKGCSFLEGLAWFLPGEADRCTNFLWIEDEASNLAIWGERPA